MRLQLPLTKYQTVNTQIRDKQENKTQKHLTGVILSSRY
jgi:hypothetical protein